MLLEMYNRTHMSHLRVTRQNPVKATTKDTDAEERLNNTDWLASV